MSKKNATSMGLIKKAETLLTVIPYLEDGDGEDLREAHYQALEYVRLIPRDSRGVSGVSSGSVVHEAIKLYRRAFRRLRAELSGGKK